MSLIEDVRKNTPTSPLYAAVGVTDLAVELARDARLSAEQTVTRIKGDLAPARVQGNLTAAADGAVAQAKELPARALNEVLVLGGRAAEGYDKLVHRGEKLIRRLRSQQSTQDLIHQAEVTVEAGKGAMTSARKAVVDVERSAKATLTTGRKEAEKVVEAIAETVKEDTLAASEQVAASVKRTRTAAKRTTTTTRNAGQRASAKAKAASTSARKTATAAKKATVKGAKKVGD